MLRAVGRNVEVQNYIDNTGVQVADVVVWFQFLGDRSAADLVSEGAARDSRRFDYLCWDLYAERSEATTKTTLMRSKWRNADACTPWRGGRWRDSRNWLHLVSDAIVGSAYRDHAGWAGRGIRCAAARERDPALAVLGDGV